MRRRTINKDDIGVVCGVMATAVAGLHAEKETPPFSKKEHQRPSVILTPSL